MWVVGAGAADKGAQVHGEEGNWVEKHVGSTAGRYEDGLFKFDSGTPRSARYHSGLWLAGACCQ